MLDHKNSELRLCTQRELRTKFGIPHSRVHLYRLEKEGKFPKRVQLTEGRIGYVEREIEVWILERLNRRLPTTLVA